MVVRKITTQKPIGNLHYSYITKRRDSDKISKRDNCKSNKGIILTNKKTYIRKQSIDMDTIIM